MSPVILYVIMAVGAATMVLGLVKDKAGAGWGRPVAIGGIVVVLLAVVLLFTRGCSKGGQEVVDREEAFNRAGGKKLGTYLAGKHAGSRVLILSGPKVGPATDRVDPLVEGFKEGLGGKLTVVGEISPEVPADKAKTISAAMPMEAGPAEGGPGGQMMPPLEYWYTAKVFDELIGKQSGFDLIVTTIGLPQDAAKSRILKDAKARPKIAVLNGTIYDLKAAIAPDMIVAAITYNPKAVYDDKPVPKDLDEAFNKRWLLVTPDTLQQVSQAHPDIFRSGK
jgi:hypothetical protein